MVNKCEFKETCEAKHKLINREVVYSDTKCDLEDFKQYCTEYNRRLKKITANIN